MKSGAYSKDRLLPEFVRAVAERRGISYTSLSDTWVIRLEQGTRQRWVLGYKFDLNMAAATAIAEDKVATHLVLQAAGVPSVEHILVRSLLDEPFPTQQLAETFSGPFVIKPLDGRGGRDVILVSDALAAGKMVAKNRELTWAASPLYDISAEYRVILLDGTPLITYKKIQPKKENGLRYFNLNRGAVPADVQTQDTQAALQDMARRACSALGLRLAAVDLVRIHGALRVIEVNDSIGLETYARHSEQYRKNAALAYDAIVTAMFR